MHDESQNIMETEKRTNDPALHLKRYLLLWSFDHIFCSHVGSYNLLTMTRYLLNNLGKSFSLAVNDTSFNWLAVQEKERVGKWLHVKSNGVREKVTVTSIYISPRELVMHIRSFLVKHACMWPVLFSLCTMVLCFSNIIVTGRTWNIYAHRGRCPPYV